MALWYTSVSDIYSALPDIGSITNLTSAQIVGSFATPAEALVNAKIAKLYVVPISPAPPLLQAISTDIAIYRILGRRVFTSQQLKDSIWVDRFKDSMELLNEIADGTIALVTSSGGLVDQLTATHAATSTTKDYHPTFHEGAIEDQVIDPEKIDDNLRDRDLLDI